MNKILIFIMDTMKLWNNNKRIDINIKYDILIKNSYWNTMTKAQFDRMIHKRLQTIKRI